MLSGDSEDREIKSVNSPAIVIPDMYSKLIFLQKF